MPASRTVVVFVEDGVEDQTENVIAIPTGELPEGYVVIARATSKSSSGPEDAVEQLREQAQEIGADAIVVTRNGWDVSMHADGRMGGRQRAEARYLRRTRAR